ncbi:MAG: DNA polymerase Y family protein [Bacteroidota bacterium]
MNRYVTIWFPYFKTDAVLLAKRALAGKPFVLTVNDHGRKLITAASPEAVAQGVRPGMVAADARAILRNLEVMDDDGEAAGKLLKRLAHWCIRYTPAVMLDNDGLILNARGCTHLWGGEKNYVKDLQKRLIGFGFHARLAIADTIGVAWAITHFTKAQLIVPVGETMSALLPLPPAALRLDPYTVEQLEKLGLRQIKSFIGMPRTSLQRRFGEDCIKKINYALGHEEEIRELIFPPEPYQERLPCLEPIVTRTGIEIALEKLLETMCTRLRGEGKGLRTAILKGYRIDGKTVSLTIGTNKASHNEKHLQHLFSFKIETFEPGPGIELFTLDAQKVEDAIAAQTQLWGGSSELADDHLSELLDRLNTRFGEGHVHRYLPDEHYWPERSVKPAQTISEKSTAVWNTDRPRPLQLLKQPERIEVTAPVPDYPPMNFRVQGTLHKIVRAEGPERIEQEWWLQTGEHRDYYSVEDEEGRRYWLYRSGHYNETGKAQWFLHGYFA